MLLCSAFITVPFLVPFSPCRSSPYFSSAYTYHAIPSVSRGMKTGRDYRPKTDPCMCQDGISRRPDGMQTGLSMSSISPTSPILICYCRPYAVAVFVILKQERPGMSMPLSYRDFAGPGKIPSWHKHGTVFGRDYRPVFIPVHTR